MKTMTLGRSDVLLAKEALEALEGSGLNDSSDKGKQIKALIHRMKLQLAQEDIKSPLSHIWKPM